MVIIHCKPGSLATKNTFTQHPHKNGERCFLAVPPSCAADHIVSLPKAPTSRAAGLPASLRSANVNSLDFYAVGRLLGKGAFGKAGCRSCRETDPERTMSKMVTDILIIYLIDL